MHIVCP